MYVYKLKYAYQNCMRLKTLKYYDFNVSLKYEGFFCEFFIVWDAKLYYLMQTKENGRIYNSFFFKRDVFIETFYLVSS